ncbi:hypothetical protein BDZ85DRAFT_277110 [Elsinoe ampelina]|uniref:Uncharacterized protein n=1 Tax=Elsinoe ampelina TaxID=302913 RepID=A0A6A6GNC0_9PEZI|nr:hypothetical protein BDZ85DRAFT_277110 [Elsinoe ampelina]
MCLRKQHMAICTHSLPECTVEKCPKAYLDIWGQPQCYRGFHHAQLKLKQWCPRPACQLTRTKNRWHCCQCAKQVNTAAQCSRDSCAHIICKSCMGVDINAVRGVEENLQPMSGVKVEDILQ